MPESALIVVVPQAEPFVRELRLRFDPSASRGMPAHVPVIAPFIAPNLISDQVLLKLRRLFKEFAPFDFHMARLLAMTSCHVRLRLRTLQGYSFRSDSVDLLPMPANQRRSV
jgi:hypothetical protein